MWITLRFGKNYLGCFYRETGFQPKNGQNPAFSAKSMKRYAGCFFIADGYPQFQRNSLPYVDKTFFKFSKMHNS